MNKELQSAELKLVLLGESSVGKSALVTRFTTGSFHKSNATIGAAFTTKVISWETETARKEVKFEIWDTAGQERYRALTPMYYRNTDVAFVVFDVTEESTSLKADSWVQELKSYMEGEEAHNIVIKLIGNKIDLLDEVPPRKVGWTPVSAKTGEGVADLFESVAREVPSSKFKVIDTTAPSSADDTVDLRSSDRARKSLNSCSC